MKFSSSAGILALMEIRPVGPTEVDALIEIDATIESSEYLHVERSGEEMAIQWKLEPRALRTRLADRNRPADELQFLLKQIANGIEDGIALLAEHEEARVALLLARPDLELKTLRIIDVRVDSDFRRQGLATAMLYEAIAEARRRELRAVFAEAPANNMPANKLFAKLAFDLAGLDTFRKSNHDLVKEVATIFWYAALD